MKGPYCTNCESLFHYITWCPYIKKKPIKPGKHTIKDRVENKKFRDSKLNFEGYLVCECCKSWNGSDADHVESKGANPDKRYTGEKQILCRPCHQNKTDGRPCQHDYGMIERA